MRHKDQFQSILLCPKCNPTKGELNHVIDFVKAPLLHQTLFKEGTAKGREHWRATQATLQCSLCDETPPTNPPPSLFRRPDYKLRWLERLFGKKSIVLCPHCVAGNWFTHNPDEWTCCKLNLQTTYTTQSTSKPRTQPNKYTGRRSSPSECVMPSTQKSAIDGNRTTLRYTNPSSCVKYAARKVTDNLPLES
jgi:hypothetical protein